MKLAAQIAIALCPVLFLATPETGHASPLAQFAPTDVVPTSETVAQSALGGLAAVDGSAAVLVTAHPFPEAASAGVEAVFMERDASGSWSESNTVAIPEAVYTLGLTSVAMEGDVAALAIATDAVPPQVRVVMFQRSVAGTWSRTQSLEMGLFIGVIMPKPSLALDGGELLVQDGEEGIVRVFDRVAQAGQWSERTTLLSLSPYFFGPVEMSVKDGLAIGLDGSAYNIFERDATGDWPLTGTITLPGNPPFNLLRMPYRVATDGEFVAIALSNDPGASSRKVYILERLNPAQPADWSVAASFDIESLGSVYYPFGSGNNFDDIVFQNGVLALTAHGTCGFARHERSPVTISRAAGTFDWVADAPHCALPLAGTTTTQVLGFDGETLLVGNPNARSIGQALGGAVALVDFTSLALDCDGNGQRDLDQIMGSPEADGNANGTLDVCETFGLRFCEGVVPNSTGQTAFLTAMGSPQIGTTPIVLRTRGVPVGSPCIHMVGSLGSSGLPVGVGGSSGRLCLGSLGFGRFSSQMSIVGATGECSVVVDPNAMPVGGALVTTAPGQHWLFQSWFADGASVSNFSDAILIKFE